MRVGLGIFHQGQKISQWSFKRRLKRLCWLRNSLSVTRQCNLASWREISVIWWSCNSYNTTNSSHLSLTQRSIAPFLVISRMPAKSYHCSRIRLPWWIVWSGLCDTPDSSILIFCLHREPVQAPYETFAETVLRDGSWLRHLV